MYGGKRKRLFASERAPFPIERRPRRPKVFSPSFYGCLGETQSRAKWNENSEYGWCPLHIAVVNDELEMVELLLENGANPDIQDMTNPFVGQVRTQLFSSRIHPTAPTQVTNPPPRLFFFSPKEEETLLSSPHKSTKTKQTQSRPVLPSPL